MECCDLQAEYTFVHPEFGTDFLEDEFHLPVIPSFTSLSLLNERKETFISPVQSFLSIALPTFCDENNPSDSSLSKSPQDCSSSESSVSVSVDKVAPTL